MRTYSPRHAVNIGPYTPFPRDMVLGSARIWAKDGNTSILDLQQVRNIFTGISDQGVQRDRHVPTDFCEPIEKSENTITISFKKNN